MPSVAQAKHGHGLPLMLMTAYIAVAARIAAMAPRRTPAPADIESIVLLKYRLRPQPHNVDALSNEGIELDGEAAAPSFPFCNV